MPCGISDLSSISYKKKDDDLLARECITELLEYGACADGAWSVGLTVGNSGREATSYLAG